jgi:hypothetical protein
MANVLLDFEGIAATRQFLESFALQNSILGLR